MCYGWPFDEKPMGKSTHSLRSFFSLSCLPFSRLSSLCGYLSNEIAIRELWKRGIFFVNLFRNGWLLCMLHKCSGCVCVCASSSFFNGLCYKSSLAILNGVNIILCYLAKAFFGFVWFDEFGFVIPSFRATFYSHLHSHTWIIRFNAAYWISLH